MRASDLAPDNPNLSAADLLLTLVDVCDALAKVEAFKTLDFFFSYERFVDISRNLLGGLGVIDTLDLDQARLGVRYNCPSAFC